MGKIMRRVLIVVPAVALQVLWHVLLVKWLAPYAPLIVSLLSVAAVFMVLFIVIKRDESTYKLLWLLIILTMPLVGALLYLFFGNKRTAKPLKKRLQGVASRGDPRPLPVGETPFAGEKRMEQTIRWLERKTGYPLCKAQPVRYYPLGDDMFPDMLRDMKSAKRSIYIEYFIIEPGQMWDAMLEVLEDKLRQGVDVRVIYDGVGSAATLPVKYPDILHARGILCRVFQPLVPVLSIHQNNRDHRKITVIDGVTGYVSGLNLADEYVDRKERFGYWKDAALRVEGDAAWNFTVMFLNFWNAFRPSETDYDAFRPMPLVPLVPDGVVQPYADSPLDEEPMAETVYLNILAQAKQYVYIYTPYLAIGEEMLDALKNAAKRGVDVRLVLPGIPDKKLVFRLSRSYYLPLLRAGVRIYEFTPGFLHAKCWVSDDSTAVVGSINMDYRSLFLHFECGVLLQNNSQVTVLRDDVRDTLLKCREVQVSDCHTGLLGTVLDSVLRLLSPLM